MACFSKKHGIQLGIILNYVNTSIRTGVFPDQLKISTVMPIPKVLNTQDACNFRPINTLPTLEKVLERIIHGTTG